MDKSDMQYTDDDDEMRDMQCTDDDDEMRGGECIHDCIQEERVRGRAGCGFDAHFHSNFANLLKISGHLCINHRLSAIIWDVLQ